MAISISRSKSPPFNLPPIPVTLCFLSLTLAANLVVGQDRVEFLKDVQPILKRHCLDCHAADDARGDLSLDTPAGVNRGGHSGSAIVGGTPEKSELFLRVTSVTDGYRMPQEGPPLSDDEIKVLRAWIEQGGRWDASISAGNKASEPATATNKAHLPLDSAPESAAAWFAGAWNRISLALEKPSWLYATIVMAGVIGLLTLKWLLSNFETKAIRARRQATTSAEISATIKPRRWVGYGVVLFLAPLLCLTAFLWGRVEELQTEIRSQPQQVQSSKKTMQTEIIVTPENLVMPPYPMHPKRLGGVYYRGNDERDPRLYNGGFYRTATIELWLVDKSGTRLKPGDKCPEDFFVELTVNRAPNATKELFSTQVLKQTYLKHFPEDDTANTHLTRFDFEIVTPEEKWQRRVLLSPIENDSAAGMIYLFYGGQDFGVQTGRVHFGIRYGIHLSAGHLTSDSELWMGSIYNLGGRVLVPGNDELLLDRWFDFRPIPLIEGAPSTDPKLLGLPDPEPLSLPDPEPPSLPDPEPLSLPDPEPLGLPEHNSLAK